MSLYVCQIDPLRRHHGGNAMDRAAYQAREHIVCPVTKEVYDHTGQDDLVWSEMVGTQRPRDEFWLRAELAERRFKAVVARSFKLALPVENDEEANKNLLLRFASYLSERLNTVVDAAYHRRPSNDEDANDHGHLLVASRVWDEETLQLGAKTRDLDRLRTGSKLIAEFRQVWETMVNQSLPKWATPVTCRSHKDRGTGLLPTRHLGKVATEMERRGMPTIRGEYNETVDAINDLSKEISLLTAELEALMATPPPALDLASEENPAPQLEVVAVPVPLTPHATPEWSIGEAEPHGWRLEPQPLDEDLALAFQVLSKGKPMPAQKSMVAPAVGKSQVVASTDITETDLVPASLEADLIEARQGLPPTDSGGALPSI